MVNSSPSNTTSVITDNSNTLTTAETVSAVTSVVEETTQIPLNDEIAASTDVANATTVETSSNMIVEETEITITETEEIIITLPIEKVEVELEQLSEETTVSELQSTVAEVIETDAELYVSDINLVNARGIALVAIIALIVAVLIIIRINCKRLKRYAADSAAAKDAQRLSSEKSRKSAYNKPAPKNSKKNKGMPPKHTLQTLPYKKVLSDNVWLIEKNTYSKAYTFDDINFNLADEEQQYDYLDKYIRFLNIFDDSVDAQICLWNSRISIDDFRRRTLMSDNGDKYSNLRFEYNNRVLEENIKKGQNAIQKHMYVTLTIKASDEEAAQRRFHTLDITVTSTFNQIGNTNMRVLTSQERIEMLKDFYIDPEYNIPIFTAEQFKRDEEKIYCSPDDFQFKKNYFLFGKYYAKTIYVSDFPNIATSDIFNDILKSGVEVMITTNIETYDTASARRMVQRQMTSVDTNMAQREIKAAQHGNFGSQIPQKIKNQRDAMAKVYDKITTQDQKLFMINIQILVKASSYDELMANTNVIIDTLKRNGCKHGEMIRQQENGMHDCLPCGYKRKFKFLRTMPSESVAIFMPFNVKEVQMVNSTYYGLNVLSHNVIMFDRLIGLINPSGFILGCPGGGKSFVAKREMLEAFLRNQNADILIIDPEAEYVELVSRLDGTTVRFANGSKSCINPFDFDFQLLEDDDVDVIADKCQLITSFISCMDPNNPLNAQQKSFISRCVRKTYIKSNILDTLDYNDMPTLSDFYDIMETETENVDPKMKSDLLMTLEMYVHDGTAKYFDNKTNVDATNRMISYDIRDLSGNLKKQSMLLILEYIWNRLSKNRNDGRVTYIYIDEIYLLFADEYCLDYLKMLWKRARKYGGVLTGITQNVEDLLKDDKSRSMLSNSEFLILLKQQPSDAAKLQQILHFTDSEIKYVHDTPAGHGILVLGGKDKIPFYDEFPKDTELYKLMTTNFNETASLKQKEKELTVV